MDRRDFVRVSAIAGAVAVRFNGLDEPVVEGAPDFMKSLNVDHARDGEVMIAFAMNGKQLPLLNGFLSKEMFFAEALWAPTPHPLAYDLMPIAAVAASGEPRG